MCKLNRFDNIKVTLYGCNKKRLFNTVDLTKEMQNATVFRYSRRYVYFILFRLF